MKIVARNRERAKRKKLRIVILVAMKDTTRSIFRSAQHFFSGTAISRVTGLLRDVTMAFAFGTHAAVAAFMVAFRLSHLLRRMLGEGCLQVVFVPHFEEIRHKDPDKAYRFFRSLSLGLVLLLVGIVTLSMGAIAAILSFYELSEGNREILQLTFLMLPSLFFICLFGLNASLLQCERSYFIPSVAPTAFNLVWAAGAWLLRGTPPAEAMPWLAGATVIACTFQWLFTLPQTAKVWTGFDWDFSAVKKLGVPFLLGLIGVTATQVNSAMDALFARYADAGGPALLWYAIRIQQLPLALFGIALSGALLPPLSRAIKAQDFPKFRTFLAFALERTLQLLTPLAAGMILFGAMGVHLLYGRGSFTLADTINTTQCLWGYAFGLLPTALVLIFAPAFYAQGNYRTPVYASLLSVGINLFLNTLFIRTMGYGPASVAYATSISAISNALFLGYSLSRQMGGIAISPWATGLATLAASCVALTIEYLLTGTLSSLALLQGKEPSLASTLPQQLLTLGLPGMAFLATYALLEGQGLIPTESGVLK